MHLSRMLFFAGGDECLAEARRAAIVDRKDGIATIGQPLVIAAIAVDIAAPRTTVDDEDHRQRPRRAVTIDIRRQGQV